MTTRISRWFEFWMIDYFQTLWMYHDVSCFSMNLTSFRIQPFWSSPVSLSSLVFSRRGVAEPWGGPDRRELLGELVACHEGSLIFPVMHNDTHIKYYLPMLAFANMQKRIYLSLPLIKVLYCKYQSRCEISHRRMFSGGPPLQLLRSGFSPIPTGLSHATSCDRTMVVGSSALFENDGKSMKMWWF